MSIVCCRYPSLSHRYMNVGVITIVGEREREPLPEFLAKLLEVIRQHTLAAADEDGFAMKRNKMGSRRIESVWFDFLEWMVWCSKERRLGIV